MALAARTTAPPPGTGMVAPRPPAAAPPPTPLHQAVAGLKARWRSSPVTSDLEPASNFAVGAMTAPR